MSKPLLQVKNLIKDFHDGERTLRVLQGVDFTLRPDEVVAIMGQSGSGKSTLLHLLCMLDRPTEGTIRMGDDELTAMSSSNLNRVRRDKVGLVFQFHHLLQEFRAWENVAMPAIIAGRSRAEARGRAMDLLKRVGLEDRVNHFPPKMSGGEQQRVALARAMMNRPSIIMADEPTGNLDAKTGERVIDLLWQTMKTPGRSMVIVTHEANVAANADRVLVLEDGVLREG